MNEIKYLPVNVIEEECTSSSSVYTLCCDEDSKFYNCSNELLKSPFEIKEVQDYIDTLHVYSDLPYQKCENIWGTYSMSDILNMSPEELVNKYKEYKDYPKVGEIWENVDNEYKVIIIGIKEVNNKRVVEYWTCNEFWKGEEDIRTFVYLYKNTDVSCGSLSTFIKELKDKNV